MVGEEQTIEDAYEAGLRVLFDVLSANLVPIKEGPHLREREEEARQKFREGRLLLMRAREIALEEIQEK